ncbi:hypothetical protein K1X45_15805 [Pseudochrobactrum sp. Wa41.01b-1]|uniref:hypothetical protein n=1 Tax=Pseudochrobactrum sp. Wa41.01b-1 TaxID=2864102 RepID=UPI001C690843|nr:hypothetical protein [Pseudochrobactrum sp. Wa41.01b-1]QYM72872.1 hypothetical protein K1X45_15805 [Pseudochrobactrum sp. Wa41.01b-1]
MTRDELIKEVAYQMAIEKCGGDNPIPDPRHFESMATVAVDTVFTTLNKQTEEMTFAARHLMMWLTGGRPSEKNLKFWCERQGLPVPVGCEDIDHVPPKSAMAAWVFEAMLNASPIAPALKGQRNDK